MKIHIFRKQLLVLFFVVIVMAILLALTSCSSVDLNEQTYTVTFDPVHGTVSEDFVKLEIGQKLVDIPTPERGNYVFMGWYTEKRGGVKADLENYNLSMEKSSVLYARWAPVELYQFDDKWAKQKYSTDEYNDTVRGSGCGPGVMAIADATINNSDADIGTACEWSLEYGYFTHENGRTKDGFFEAYGKVHNLDVAQLYDKDLRDLSEEKASAYHDYAFDSVKEGNWIVAFMGEGKWTTGGHFVLWYNVSDDGDVFIRDTNSMKPYKATNKFDVFKETVIRYWEIEVPDGKKLI